MNGESGGEQVGVRGEGKRSPGRGHRAQGGRGW